jgi:small subunit ribosomal protein S20
MAQDQQPEKKVQKTKISSAKKREVQDIKKRVANRAFRSKVRSAIKIFTDSVTEGNKEKQMAALSEVYSLVDKGVNKSIFKRNKANRIKERLTARLHAKAS